VKEELNEFLDLDDRKRKLKTELKEVEDRMSEIESDLLEKFADAGVSSIKSDRGKTVYLHAQYWAGLGEGSDYDMACDALCESGLEPYVQRRFNTQSLSAYVRECIKNEEELPDAVKNHIKVTEKHSVRVRKG